MFPPGKFARFIAATFKKSLSIFRITTSFYHINERICFHCRIEYHFHYLDFRKVESKRSTHIAFTFAVSGGSGEKTYSFRPHLDQPDVTKEAHMIDDILISLAAAVRRIYPGECVTSSTLVTPRDFMRTNLNVLNITQKLIIV